MFSDIFPVLCRQQLVLQLCDSILAAVVFFMKRQLMGMLHLTSAMLNVNTARRPLKIAEGIIGSFSSNVDRHGAWVLLRIIYARQRLIV